MKRFKDISTFTFSATKDEKDVLEGLCSKNNSENFSEYVRTKYEETRAFFKQNLDLFIKNKTVSVCISLPEETLKLIAEDANKYAEGNRTLLMRAFIGLIERLSGNKEESALTEKQLVRKMKLESCSKMVEDLKQECDASGHHIVRLYGKHGEKTPYARCSICDSDFGLYCEDSPDHACHIDVNKKTGKVDLLTGISILPPSNSELLIAQGRCLFCGKTAEEKEQEFEDSLYKEEKLVS